MDEFLVRWHTLARRALVPLALASLAAAIFPLAASAAITLPQKNGPLGDFDARAGSVAPTVAQEQAAAALGAEVRWNRFGTPQSLVSYEGDLGSTSGDDAIAAARAWVDANKALFRLASLESLAAGDDSRLSNSEGHVVVFRQKFGGLTATRDGLLTVGLVGTPSAGWKVTYASSSVSGETGLAAAPQLSAAEAWLRAASDVGRNLSILDIRGTRVEHGWTVLDIAGFYQPRARLTALPRPGAPAIPAFEALVVDLRGGETAFRSFVDARTGAVVVRQNVAFHSHFPGPATIQGATPFGECDVPKTIGVVHPDATPQVRTIDVAASFADPSADMVLKLKRDGVTIQSIDTGTSPEAIHYEPAAGVPPGVYAAEVCHLAGSLVPQTGVLLAYAGEGVFGAGGPATLFAHPPKWRVFPAYPRPASLPSYPWNVSDDDTRRLWCWDTNVAGTQIPGCSEEVKNAASRAPWDFDTKANLPTFSTRGNNAITAESWVAEIVNPGPTQYRPVSPTRTYDNPGSVNAAEVSNDWFHAQVPGQPAEGCGQVDSSPQQSFTPGVGYDISAAVVNLFAMHNRMHDWAYHLGFTEENFNAQEDNFGETPPAQENDALIGNAQEAALTGPTPVLGRTNANMVPLPEGVRPITNMYLFQTFAGVIYVPCVDGDFDMSIIGHEYGHLIENRMIAKGGTRFGHHAGSMGEGYGDLIGMEVLQEYGYTPVNGENPFTVGAYVSGNKDRSIRNYAMNQSPLTFGDIGYDYSTGDEVHADGEIWMAVNFDIRQALVAKYDKSYPASNAALQRECAQGVRPASVCPGNRRWAQLLFDGMLLMPADPTMLDARDAMLAADQMRTSGQLGWTSNQNELWLAYARRGFGRDAFTESGGGDSDPVPDFASPRHSSTTVTFTATGPDGPDAGSAPDPVNARIYVGKFEARISPIADTDAGTSGAGNLDNVARFAPGTYSFLAHAPGGGHLRFTRNFPGPTTVALSFPANLASQANGALPVGIDDCTPPSGEPADQCDLIDDTEVSAWQGVGTITLPSGVGSVEGVSITIDLAGELQTVNSIHVSGAGDPAESGKFSWLRQFEILTCSTNCTLENGDVNQAAFTLRFTSPANAFPGDAPWPVVGHVSLRSFAIPTTQATHVQLRVLDNQCTGQTQFHGEQDGDPANPTDCVSSPISTLFGSNFLVTAAELQVFGPAK